jgi:hypothetical protein
MRESSIKRSWGNGYGGMLMRRKLGGDRFWWLSMVLCGEVGDLVSLMRLMGWGIGSIFVWGGAILRGTLDLTLGLALGLVFGRMFGVGRAMSKTLFGVCLALPVSRRHLLRIMWSDPTVLSSGTLCSLV